LALPNYGATMVAQIQDEELMPSERRFRDDGTKATRLHKPDYGDDRMQEYDEDVVHAGIVSRSQKLLEFRTILEFATDSYASRSCNRASLRPFSKYAPNL
jgi:hypothetical protein